MKGYAYFDKYGILHVVRNEATAQKFGSGVYVEVAKDFPFDMGYPLNRPGGGQVVVYKADEVYEDGNRSFGKRTELNDLPHIKKVYDQLVAIGKEVAEGDEA